MKGDLGWFDERGYLCLAGRIEDMLKSGGKRYPSLVLEKIVMVHPNVEEAVFYMISDNKIGVAVILKDGGAILSEKQLLDWMNSLLPAELPLRICFVHSVPRTSRGIIQRFKLRQKSSL